MSEQVPYLFNHIVEGGIKLDLLLRSTKFKHFKAECFSRPQNNHAGVR